MGTVILREYVDVAYSKTGGQGAGDLVKGELATDRNGTAIKTVNVGAVAVDCPKLTARTHFVGIEPTDCNVRYAVRPKALRWTPLPATVNHNPVPAGAVVYEAVYPGAIISFLQTATPTTGPAPFRPGYVPVLAL